MPISRQTLGDLNTPAVILDKTAMESNLRAMQQLADTHGVKLRPHIKSHKSAYLAKRQLEVGACGVAVAKLGEAEVMAAHGITDIQVANQVTGRQKIDRLLALARSCRITAAVDSVSNVLEMGGTFAAHGLTARLMIEIDTGLHRSGLDTLREIRTLAEIVVQQPGVELEGIMTHAGHAYAAQDLAAVARIGKAEGNQMTGVAALLRQSGLEISVVSVGSTPTARYSAAVPGVTELRVGNYIFNDAIQVALGVAGWDSCALTVLASVISVSNDRVVLDSGSKILSSDSGAHGTRLVNGYGQIVGMPHVVTRLSEEHGVVQARDTGLRLGDRVRIFPNHACPVMNLVDEAWLLGQDESVERIAIDARGRVS